VWDIVFVKTVKRRNLWKFINLNLVAREFLMKFINLNLVAREFLMKFINLGSLNRFKQTIYDPWLFFDYHIYPHINVG